MPSNSRVTRLTGIVIVACAFVSACAAHSVGPAVPALQAGDMFQPTVADVQYASKSAAEKLDLYLPKAGETPSPLVIWIHGGGFRVGDKRSIRRRRAEPPPRPAGRDGPYQIQVPDVVALNAKGYAVAAINYRLGPSMDADAVAAIQDGKAAVRFLRANAGPYHLDPRKFAVWGNSAGGYMAAMLGATGDQRTVFDAPALGNATTSSAIQAAVVWFGAEDRLPGPALKIAGYLPAAAVLPAFLIANGDADPVISSEQARRLHAALHDAGATSTLTIIPGAGHEDPAFMATQMVPTFQFLDQTFGR